MATEPVESTAPEAVNAPIGQRMVEVKIRFLTDEVVDGEGVILPKHVNGKGFLTLEPNEAHGIPNARGNKPFNSMAEIPAVLEKLLSGEGVTVHTRRTKAARYITD